MEPQRSAHATIRGYVYQSVLAVKHWLALQPGEVLLCEGDEDIDRLLLSGEHIATQAKDYLGSLNIRDAAVRDSLANFLRAFVARRRQGQTERFVFVTTAARRAQRGDDLPVDILKEWDNAAQRLAVIDSVRTVVSAPDDVAWLDEDAGRWNAFIESIEWNFAAPGLDDLLREIDDTLRGDARTRRLPAALLGPSLLTAVLRASARGDVSLRTLTTADLDGILRQAEDELRRVVEGKEVLFARTLFGEALQLRHILWDGRSKGRDDLRTPSRLLRAEFEVVPFAEAGRAEDFAALEQWCAEERPAAVWLWTGPGGIGKTRFFIEWCKRLGRRGWHVGFVKTSTTADELRPLFESEMPCCAVIDYAETRRPLVERLLQMLAEHAAQGKTPPVRLILVSRRAGDWWEQFRNIDGLVGNLMEGARDPRELRPLAPSATERVPLFRVAVAALASALAKPEPSTRPTLDDPVFDRVLFIHIAALAALDGQQLRGRGELLEFALEHERRFWFQDREDNRIDPLTKKALDEAMEPVVVGLTLVGGAPNSDAALSLIKQVRDLTDERASWVLDRLVRLYAVEAGAGLLLPLQPDLLGEYAVASYLARRDRRQAGDARCYLERVLEVGCETALSYMITLLGRIATGFDRDAACRWLQDVLSGHLEEGIPSAIQAAIELGKVPAESSIETVLIETLRLEGSWQLADRMAALCPEQTVSLAELKSLAAGMIVAHLKSLGDVESKEVRVKLARQQANHAVALARLGRLDEAVVPTQEAVQTYRTLAADSPDEFLPYLATCLNNLGGTLSHLGRRDEALAATREAVEIRRTLATACPEKFLPDLAMSLNTLGGTLSHLGKREESLGATQEAVQICRTLAAAAPPEAFLPNLAVSLGNLGNALVKVGKRGPALAAAEEATQIRRTLAAARPDAFLPDLASSLNNLGNVLKEVGAREAALAAAREAAEIYRLLATARPDAFLSDLAGALNNLGNRLGEVGKQEAALAATQEAVELARSLALARPDAFLPDLAMFLDSMGNWLSELGKQQAALRVTQEAADIRRTLASGCPDAFLPDLAGSLNNLGNRLGELGKSDAALAATQEAVKIYRTLAAAHPDRFRPDLALSLTNLGGMLSRPGAWEEALVATQEAVEIYRTLAAGHANTFLPGIAASLTNLGAILSELGNREEALTVTQEAVDIRRRLVAEEQDAFLPDLASSLNHLGNRFSELGNWDGALAATQEAVEIRRRLAAEQPDAFLPALAMSLNNVGNTLSHAGKRDEAFTVVEEAVKTLAPLFIWRPRRFVALMSAMLGNYTRLGSAVQRPIDAQLVASILEAVAALAVETRDEEE